VKVAIVVVVGNVKKVVAAKIPGFVNANFQTAFHNHINY